MIRINVLKLDGWSLPSLWHLSDISAIFHFWPQRQIVGDQLTPLTRLSRNRGCLYNADCNLCCSAPTITANIATTTLTTFRWSRNANVNQVRADFSTDFECFAVVITLLLTFFKARQRFFIGRAGSYPPFLPLLQSFPFPYIPFPFPSRPRPLEVGPFPIPSFSSLTSPPLPSPKSYPLPMPYQYHSW